ncbi:MAG: hypothetical protein JWM10_1193 [Myxococcaceae bacterium]|nr:hypothetical protein [Myxococcaceae bacterium]
MSAPPRPFPPAPLATFFGVANPMLGAGGALLSALGGDAWRKGVVDHLARVQAVTDVVVRVEAIGLAHTRAVTEETFRLTEATLNYTAEVSALWRKAWFDAARATLGLDRAEP